MPKAFIFVNTEIGSEAGVLEKLKEIQGVEEAFIVYGLYDIVAKVNAETMDKLKETVTLQIRKISKVMSTLTMIIEEFQN